MRATEVAFVGTLINRFRILLPIMQEHLNSYEGLLPHVFMGDFTRWVIDRLLYAGMSDQMLDEILKFVEESFKEGGEEERELIAVSFLENLPQLNEAGSEIRNIIGPTLQEELIRIGK